MPDRKNIRNILEKLFKIEEIENILGKITYDNEIIDEETLLILRKEQKTIPILKNREISSEELHSWIELNNPQYKIVYKKISKLKIEEDEIPKVTEVIVKDHLIGSYYIDEILQKNALLHEDITKLKETMKKQLIVFRNSENLEPNLYFKRSYDDYYKDLKHLLGKSYQKPQLHNLALEGIGEWLIDCDLDF